MATATPDLTKVNNKREWTPFTPAEATSILASARPAEAPCLCGCGGLTKGRFVPGHDAVLKARLNVTVETGSKSAASKAREAIAVFGW